VAAFTVPIYRATLAEAGLRGATGADQAVPGMAALFGFFVVQFLGLAFFRDHGWGVWDRLRASPAGTAGILLGKVAVAALVMAAQQVVIFTVGALLLGVRFRGSLFALALISVAFTVCLLAFGLAVVSVCHSMQQLSVVVNVGSLLFAGVGGALVPLAVLPAWLSVIGRTTPIYWAMRGFDAVILDGGGVTSVLLPVGLLVVETVVLLVVAVSRFRVDETKRGW
jgi:ABC-2 type transport system permease protein